MPDPWAEYIKALNRCAQATKFTAFHTLECARQTEIASVQTRLTVYYVREYLETLQDNAGRVLHRF